LEGIALTDIPSEGGDSGISAYVSNLFDASLSWADLAWLKS
jgi:isopentenyl diphosphate isomerase/L-lactate dehydrogenase-like FMN-dependent dehydrogenase